MTSTREKGCLGTVRGLARPWVAVDWESFHPVRTFNFRVQILAWIKILFSFLTEKERFCLMHKIKLSLHALSG